MPASKRNPLDWRTLDRILFDNRKGIRLESKKISPNTFAARDEDDVIAVSFHGGRLLEYAPPSKGGSIAIVNTYKSNTTKARLNEYLPPGWSIFQDGGQWWLQNFYENDNPTIVMKMDPGTILVPRSQFGRYEAVIFRNGREVEPELHPRFVRSRKER